jgi:hypothetical protein
MKSIYKENDAKIGDIKFPILAELINTTFIVLFTSNTNGTVVFTDYDQLPIGTYSTKWSDVRDSSYWTILKSGKSVTLIQD